MGSTVAVAYKCDPVAFLEHVGHDYDAPRDGLRVHLGQDVVVVFTSQHPSITIDAVLAEVEGALGGLQALGTSVAVGLGGGELSETTTFAEWTEHWIRGAALQDGQQSVARAMFTLVVDSGLSTTDIHAVAQDPR